MGITKKRMCLREVGHILLVGGVILNVLVLLLGIEAGAVLVNARQVAVAQDDGFGVVDEQRLQQGVQGGLLLWGAGVLGTALGVQSTLVADADAVLVVVAGVGTDEVLVAGLVDLAVAGDVVMVAGESEPAVVAGDERRHRKGLVLPRRTAVDDYQINLSHIAHRYLVVVYYLSHRSLRSHRFFNVAQIIVFFVSQKSQKAQKYGCA